MSDILGIPASTLAVRISVADRLGGICAANEVHKLWHVVLWFAHASLLDVLTIRGFQH